MANAKKCDRCGVFYEPTGKLDEETHPYVLCRTGRIGLYDMGVDLCPSCEEELKKFMCTDYTFNQKLAEFDEKHFGGPLEKENENET